MIDCMRIRVVKFWDVKSFMLLISHWLFHHKLSCFIQRVGYFRYPRHCGSWEPPGRFLDNCKFLFSLVQSSHAGIKIQPLKNISSSPFWKKSKINNFTSFIAHKIYWAGKKYFLTAYLNSWCNFLSFDRSHCIFWWRNKIFIFLATVTNFQR